MAHIVLDALIKQSKSREIQSVSSLSMPGLMGVIPVFKDFQSAEAFSDKYYPKATIQTVTYKEKEI